MASMNGLSKLGLPKFSDHMDPEEMCIRDSSQIGRLAAGYAGTIGALPCAQCTFIIFQHKNSFFL